MREVLRSGLDYLETMTTLLQRMRNSHPTKGLYEAAEIQFWWARPRSTDDLPQLFWLDDNDLPVAAVTTTDFGAGASSILYDEPTSIFAFMPDTPADFVSQAVALALEHLGDHGISKVDAECDRADEMMRHVLFDQGFSVKEERVMEEAWLPVDQRPATSELPDGYALLSRAEMLDRPHHLTRSNGADPEQRLRTTSLYRPDLDLVVVDSSDQVAAYGMFWHDPATGVGVVEPMRTMDDHQGRGLARHILTNGIERLAKAGSTRISIGYDPGHNASGPLYRSVGFEPHRTNDLLTIQTRWT